MMNECETTMRRMKACAAACLLLILSVSGCARLSIPAPDDPVQQLVQPAIEDSVITLPLTVQTKTAGGDRLSEGGGNDNPRGTIAGKIRKFLNRQTAKFDDRLLQHAYVQLAAGWAWEALQSPVKLKDDYYLLLNPEALKLLFPAEHGDASESTLAVMELLAKPKIAVGKAPQVISRSTPSISLATVPQGKGFHLALETEVSFALISGELTDRLKNKTYVMGGRSMTIEGIRVYASGSSAVLEVRVSGDREGTLYLSGIPQYNAETRKLSIRNIDYTVATKNILVHTADWMVHTELRARLEEQAQWPLGERIDEAGVLLTKALNREINRHIAITGTISRVQPVAIGLTLDSIKAVLVVDGAVELKVF